MNDTPNLNEFMKKRFDKFGPQYLDEFMLTLNESTIFFLKNLQHARILLKFRYHITLKKRLQATYMNISLKLKPSKILNSSQILSRK